MPLIGEMTSTVSFAVWGMLRCMASTYWGDPAEDKTSITGHSKVSFRLGAELKNRTSPFSAEIDDWSIEYIAGSSALDPIELEAFSLKFDIVTSMSGALHWSRKNFIHTSRNLDHSPFCGDRGPKIYYDECASRRKNSSVCGVRAATFT